MNRLVYNKKDSHSIKHYYQLLEEPLLLLVEQQL